MLANNSKILPEDQQTYSEHEISIAGIGNTPTRAPRSWEGSSEPGRDVLQFPTAPTRTLPFGNPW